MQFCRSGYQGTSLVTVFQREEEKRYGLVGDE